MKIGVLYGGPSAERAVSLRSGQAVAEALAARYTVELIEVTQNNQFVNEQHQVVARCDQGKLASYDYLTEFDVLFNALHGTFGEDGQLQRLLDVAGLRYTGSGEQSSRLCMDKNKLNKTARGLGFALPVDQLIVLGDDITYLVQAIESVHEYPLVVKPNDSGSSVGVKMIYSHEDLVAFVAHEAGKNTEFLVQQCIVGRELTCGVLGNSDSHVVALPVVEIKTTADFFDYDAKYHDTTTQEICPAKIPVSINEMVQQHARQIHTAAGCAGLTRSDFILDENNILYFLETNTSPGLTPVSLCPKEARAAGYAFVDFLDKIVQLAL